jgi:hypothetical protein
MTPSNLLHRDYAAVLRLHHSLPCFGAFELKVSAHKFRIPQKGKDRKTPTICTSPTIRCNPDRFFSAMDREEAPLARIQIIDHPRFAVCSRRTRLHPGIPAAEDQSETPASKQTKASRTLTTFCPLHERRPLLPCQFAAPGIPADEADSSSDQHRFNPLATLRKRRSDPWAPSAF